MNSRKNLFLLFLICLNNNLLIHSFLNSLSGNPNIILLIDLIHSTHSHLLLHLKLIIIILFCIIIFLLVHLITMNITYSIWRFRVCSSLCTNSHSITSIYCLSFILELIILDSVFQILKTIHF